MDMTVRVVCVILMLVACVVLFDSFKLLLESNNGKKFTKTSKPRLQLQKPKIKAKNLIKAASFFVMVNHGPNLSETEIPNIPYYKGKSCLSALGDNNDKNERTDMDHV